ncbi:MAG: HAD family hydrolase [Myxococcota bacterium]|nr:HAD family hydrolase [Myxococcota bacterium]
MGIKLLITDLDNTLYDWVGFYVPSFLAMVEEIHRISGLPTETLKKAFKRVHEKHGTTEYAFAIEELDVLVALDEGLSVGEKLAKYDSAIHAFRSMRRKLLRPYPGVKEGLDRLVRSGIRVVAHTDSLSGYVSRRLRQLELDSFFAAICAPKDHGVPFGLDAAMLQKADPASTLARCQVLDFPDSFRKPDPRTLDPVFQTFGVSPAETAYLGDSKTRDVWLARQAGVLDIWASYGTAAPSLYGELVQITYWTKEDLKQDEMLRKQVETIAPSCPLLRSTKPFRCV